MMKTGKLNDCARFKRAACILYSFNCILVASLCIVDAAASLSITSGREGFIVILSIVSTEQQGVCHVLYRT